MTPLRILAAALLASSAFAGDAVITLQFQSKTARFAAGTSPLESETVVAIGQAFPNVAGNVVNNFPGQIDKLPPSEITKNWRDACAAFARLGTGALLVLNCHASIVEIGVPCEDGSTKLIPWTRLWSHFGVARPPLLGLVVLNGCVGRTYEDGTKGESTDEDLDRLRCRLSTAVLVGGTRSIATADTQVEIRNMMKMMKPGDAGGTGWDVDLSPDKGYFSKMKYLKIRTGRLYDQSAMNMLSFKREAIDLAKLSDVKPDGPRELVFQREDDADPDLVKFDQPVRRLSLADPDPAPAFKPFRFEFRPRAAVVQVVLQVNVQAARAEAKDDAITALVGGAPLELAKDFAASKDRETLVEKTFTKASHPALIAEIQSGRLRCAMGVNTWVKGANLVVTYEEAK